METLKSTPSFSVSVDASANGLFLHVEGPLTFDSADDLADTIRAAFSRMQPGFTVVLDMTKAGPQMPWLRDFFEAMKIEALLHGMSRLAEIREAESAAQLQEATTNRKSERLCVSLSWMEAAKTLISLS